MFDMFTVKFKATKNSLFIDIKDFEEILNKINNISNGNDVAYSEILEIDNTNNNTDMVIEELVDDFRKLYKENKKHLYFEIYSLLARNNKLQSKSIINFLYYVDRVLERLEKHKNNNDTHIITALKKLKDYLNDKATNEAHKEEIVVNQTQYKLELNKYKINIEQYNEKITRYGTNIEELGKKLEKSKNDYIVVLGIFASIILSFVGSLTFTSSILSNIDKANIFKLISAFSMSAIVFTNLIFTLLSYINKIRSNKTCSGWMAVFIILVNLVLIYFVCFGVYNNCNINSAPIFWFFK